jgi:hypothetical protein
MRCLLFLSALQGHAVWEYAVSYMFRTRTAQNYFIV